MVDEMVQGGYRSRDTKPRWPTAFAFNISHAHCLDDIERGSRIPCTWEYKGQPLDPHGNLTWDPCISRAWVEGQGSEFGVFTIRAGVCGVNEYLSWEIMVA